MKKISTQLLVNFVIWRILEKLWRIASKFCSVQFSHSVMTPWIAACQASLSITSSQKLLKLMSIESVMPSNHLILLLSIFPSIRVFSNFQWVSCLHQVAKVLELELQHQCSNEYSGLISFRTDWFDPSVVQGTFKSLFQDHSSKAL